MNKPDEMARWPRCEMRDGDPNSTNSQRHEPISGADGVKIAVLRRGRANLEFIWAAAHLNRLCA